MDDMETRSLKRREVKALKAMGYNMGSLRPEQIDDFMDEVFALVFDADELARIDDMDQSACMTLLNRIMDDTSGRVPETDAKN